MNGKTIGLVLTAVVVVMVAAAVSSIFLDQFNLFSDTSQGSSEDSSCELLLSQGSIEEASEQGCEVCESGGNYNAEEGACCTGAWRPDGSGGFGCQGGTLYSP